MSRAIIWITAALAGACASAPPRAAGPAGRSTTLEVKGAQILLNGQASTLLGFRVGSAALRDDWTAALIAELPTWRAHGVNALILWMQGTSGGAVRAFTADGSALSTTEEPIVARTGYGVAEVPGEVGRTSGAQVLARTQRILDAADAHGMGVIVGVIYRRSLAPTDTVQTVTNMMRTTAAAVRDRQNVMLAIWNEADIRNPLETPASHRIYARALREVAPARPICGGSKDAPMNRPIGEVSELDAICQDAGRDLPSTLAVFDELAPLGKPVINVESFGASGGGYVDQPTAPDAAPVAYLLPFERWHRVLGAFEEEDYQDGTGRRLMGRRSYRALIAHVTGAPQRRAHAMMHVAGWFQGASRTAGPTQVGAPGTPGRWNNVFHPGHGRGAGTIEEPGVRWLLDALSTASRSPGSRSASSRHRTAFR